MLSHDNSPQTKSTSESLCRSHHARIREWLENLEAAGDGAWVVNHSDSTEINVVGDVIDPVPVNRITDETTDNEIVGIYTNDYGYTQMVIELCPRVHESLCQSGQSILHFQMDEVLTKQDVGMI